MKRENKSLKEANKIKKQEEILNDDQVENPQGYAEIHKQSKFNLESQKSLV